LKESAGVNIDENVNDLLPKFFDYVPDNNCFLSGENFRKKLGKFKKKIESLSSRANLFFYLFLRGKFTIFHSIVSILET
jgi:hypothetical protein